MGRGNHKYTSFSTEARLPIPRYGLNPSDGYAMMMSPKGETAAHGYHYPDDTVVRMRKVLAIPLC